MEEKKYKRNNIILIIFFILVLVFVMFLPNISTYFKVKKYEKEQAILLDKKQEEEEQIIKQNKTTSKMICSSDDESYTFIYNSSGLQKYTKKTETEVTEEESQTKLDECNNNEVIKGIEKKCELNNDSLIEEITYDFNKMETNYRKDNIFDYKYNSSIETIKTELTNKKYTCG